MFERIGRTAGHRVAAPRSLRHFRLTRAAPCSAMARTTSRSVNMPDRGVPSVRTTSLTTSALILLARSMGGDTDSLVHTHRRNAGSFLAQDVSDLHRKPPSVSHGTSRVRQHWYTICQLFKSNIGENGRSRNCRSGSNIDIFRDSAAHYDTSLSRATRVYERSWHLRKKRQTKRGTLGAPLFIEDAKAVVRRL